MLGATHIVAVSANGPAGVQGAVVLGAALAVAAVATLWARGTPRPPVSPSRPRRIVAGAAVLLAIDTLVVTVLRAPTTSPAVGWVNVVGTAVVAAGIAFVLDEGSGRRIPGASLDAGLVAVIGLSLAWVLLVVPSGSPGWGSGAKLVTLVLVSADVFAIWLVARSDEAVGALDRVPILAALSFLLVADGTVAVSAVLSLRLPAPALVAVVRVAAYVLCAVSVLRRPAPAVSSTRRRAQRRGVGTGVLVAGILTSPAILAVRAAHGARLSLPVVVASASVVTLTVLVLVEKRGRRDSEGIHAHRDALTGLVNRTLFEDRIERAISHAEREGSELAVMFVDLDQFKLVNDSLGHSAGNELLQTLAARLRAALRAEDTAARLGGDEFGILLPKISREEDWTAVADKILHVIDQPFVMNDREFVISASLGVAVFPSDGADAMDLIDHADTAMYRAKAAGGGKRRYAATMSTRSQLRLSIESNLRLAIERDELRLHYQPKVDKDLRIVGLEALVRWYHPRLGLIGPSGFIPLAEETGLIVPMGEWILNAACRDARTWRESGVPSVPIAVNLSPRQLMSEDFESVVGSVLEDCAVEPKMLEFEVTEGVFLSDRNGAREKLLRLRDMGVHCSIDDFGTGYSALGYLARLPIESLKIDRSFVQGIGTVLGDNLVEAIISLAHNLRVKVVAEGVESERQAVFLETRGCEEFQGFLFSHPVGFDEMRSLLLGRGGASRPGPRVVPQTVVPAPARPVDALIEGICDDGPDMDDRLVRSVLDALQSVDTGGRSRHRRLPVRSAAGAFAADAS